MLWGLASKRLETGGELPKALKNEPDIEGFEWILEGFFCLSTCRQIGFGMGAIPWVHINTYADTLGLVEYSRDLFFVCIAKMDEVFIDKNKPKDTSGSKSDQDG